MTALACEAGFAVLCLVPCAAIAREPRCAWLAAFLVFAVCDQLALGLTPHELGWRIGRWNWTGKGISIALSLIAVAALGLTRSEVGLALPTGRTRWCWTLGGVAAGVAIGVALGVVFADHVRPSGPALFFESTMPGLDEELSFRGVMFAMLARAFPTAPSRWPAVVVTSLLFGDVHVIVAGHDGRLHFVPEGLLFPLPCGLLLAWLRLRSASLLGPMLAHNAADSAVQIASWLA